MSLAFRRKTFMSLKKVVVAGGGVLGSQIAFQCAVKGFDVTIWLRSEDSIKRCQPKLDKNKAAYLSAVEDMKKGGIVRGLYEGTDFDEAKAAKLVSDIENAYRSIHLELDIKKAVEDCDILIESMAENKEDKIAFYKMVAPLLPEKTILVTNSSTMLPSTFAKFTGRPEKYLSLHFANEIWRNNTAEVMGQSQTKQEYYDEVVKFAHDIGMEPLQLHKEKNGYILNSMLVPFLFSALDLYATGVSDPETIDKTWVMGTGAPAGPFHIMDVVGLQTVYNIVQMYVKIPSFLAPYHFKDMSKLVKKMLNEGKTGRGAGEGFFKYNK